MNRCFRIGLLLATILLLMTVPSRVSAQGNIDWEQRWKNTPPIGQPQHPMAWMNDSLSYTRLAYDEQRDVVYVVSPHPPGGSMWSAPAIHILDAETGQPRMDIGRSAHFMRQGQGGELPVPLDTFVTVNNQNLGFAQNLCALYSIDVDDEGRIYACNLVDPLWGICLLLPAGGCDTTYLGQGPFRVWRWDTPTSTPELIYATCNHTHTAIGSISSSEMPYSRWGDAFAVKGKRGWYQPPLGGPPVLVDSTRIYVSGGSSAIGPISDCHVAVLLPDQRDSLQRPLRDVFGGGRLSFRLGLQIDLPPTMAVNGIAPEMLEISGDTLQRWIWLRKHGGNLMKVRERQLAYAPLPQQYSPLPGDTMSLPNTSSIFGPSGAMEYFDLPEYGRKFLVAADGPPTGGPGLGTPNQLTTARLVDITQWGGFFRVWGETPAVGNADPWSIGMNNYITDVDLGLRYYTPQELPDEPGLHLRLFVLMSNNGIASFRSRSLPVELISLNARPAGVGNIIEWLVAAEENIQQYMIERSSSEYGPWNIVGSVASRGGQGNISYELEDVNAASYAADGSPASIIWYRLTALEFDGTRKIFPPVMVSRSGEAIQMDLSVFPQPVPHDAGTVYLRLQSPGQESVTVRVTDILGKDMLPRQSLPVNAGRTLLPLRVSGLPAGLYLIEARMQSGAVRVQKFIRE
ncbi:MAG: hypothetical protein WBQ23_07280 [Bacteroidota bacterium]